MYAVACIPSRAHGFPFRLDPVCVGAGVKLGLDKPWPRECTAESPGSERLCASRRVVVAWGLFNGRVREYRSAYTRYGCMRSIQLHAYSL